MSKGFKTLIGAFGGFIVMFIILNEWHDGITINDFTLLYLMPGAIIGAIVGYASGDGIKTIDKDDIGNNNESVQAAEELLKLKSLLDAGIITQEEYDKKKDEYLKKL